jgi:hypothetical protein
MRRALAKNAPLGSTISFWEFSYNYTLHRYVDLAHLPLSDLRHFPEWELLSKYHTIAILRSPYARLASACVEYYRHKSRETYQQMTLGHPSREQLLAYLRGLPRGLECRDIRYVHAFPMVWFTHYGNKPMINTLLRCESLDIDVEIIKEKAEINAQLRTSLLTAIQDSKKINKSNSLVLQSDPDLQALANIIYQDDFNTFDYDRIYSEFTDPHLADLVTSISETNCHQIRYLSFAPRVLWHWGRSCNMIKPYMPESKERL